MEEIRKSDGAPFGNKGSLAITLKRKKLTDTYEAVEKDGGWVGIEKTLHGKAETEKVEVETKEAEPKKVAFRDMPTKKYRIHRSNVDPDNRDVPISIIVNAITNKKVFWPGEEVELNESQIGVLKDSVEEIELEIPVESGIYASKNPIALAKEYYPNMMARTDPATGRIIMTQRIPNYIIEQV